MWNWKLVIESLKELYHIIILIIVTIVCIRLDSFTNKIKFWEKSLIIVINIRMSNLIVQYNGRNVEYSKYRYNKWR